jgi:type IV secretory pathway VirJ component
LSTYANFHFHWIDMVRDVHRPDDLPTAPELTKLRGLNALCVYGRDEADSGCAAADPAIVRRVSREGGHRLTSGFDAVTELIAPSLTSGR